MIVLRLSVIVFDCVFGVNERSKVVYLYTFCVALFLVQIVAVQNFIMADNML